VLAATLGLAAVLGVGTALAATLGVSSTKLTVSTYASSIPASTCTLSAADADSYVNQSSAASNFGTVTNLDVRSASGSANRRTFVQFLLTSCSIPANSLVTAATLKLYMYTAPTATRTYEARRVTGAWTETGVTWTNQPAVAGSATATVTTGTTANVTLSWDVTSDVQAYVDGTSNLGWRIADQTEGSATARLGQFRSAEYGTAAQRPILDITYYP
jgi:hypothetical protein